MRSPGLRARLAAALAAAAAAGCLGGGPAPEYFTLASEAGAGAGPALATRPGLGLAVGPLDAPRYLDRPEIATRDGAHRLVYWDAHRWGGSLRADALRVMADELGRLLGTARIAVYPDAATFPVDYRVRVELLEFEGVRGGDVALRARWTLAGADGKALAVEASQVALPTASTSFEHLVAAQSAALGQLTREIAERIAGLAAAR